MSRSSLASACALLSVLCTPAPASAQAFGKLSPVNGAAAQPSTLTLQWFASQGATGYDYCVDTTNNDLCDTNWISAGTATSAAVSVSPATTYYWQVRAQQDVPLEADGGQWWVFATNTPGPGPFGKHSPGNGWLGQPTIVPLSWYPASGVTDYQYCIDTLHNDTCDTAWVSTGTTNSATITLAGGTNYYWQVRARNELGINEADTGQWWVFRTADVVPSSADDAYTVPVSGTLTIPAPGVLTNDSGATTVAVVSTVSHGVLVLAPDGGFTYTPDPGFEGIDSFTYQATNPVGPGNVAVVTVTVFEPTRLYPPTGLYVSSIMGNVVTLRWQQPAVGVAATEYSVEGGLNPGEVLATLRTGAADPIFTFTAPAGAFYVRVHAVNASARSVASNEIRLFVHVPVPPSPPDNLLVTVNGDTVSLAWRNTFAGSAPTGLVLDIQGPPNGSVQLPLTETYTLAGLPPGIYAFSVRAVNAAGTSFPASTSGLSFPGPCSGPPQVPTGVLAYRIGSTLHLVWEPPAGGPAPTGYLVIVTGSFVGALPTSARAISGAPGPGTYTLSVRASNACGTSGGSAAQTITVP